ncbi:MAG: putative molybdenum carrier protein [Desulfuromonadaceae bacterium]|nr:putative molybdenum carrier protein [Desulfuromonadaceae bacterium]
MLQKIVSGGQTGADRAGLDAALEAGIPIGGYCPKGRLAEDGTVPDCYELTELAKGGYKARTEKNVVESDGTLILNIGTLTGGTMMTEEYAKRHGKPYLVVQLDEKPRPETVRHWLEKNAILILNVAGPRESKYPQGIYHQSISFLRAVLAEAAKEIQ